MVHCALTARARAQVALFENGEVVLTALEASFPLFDERSDAFAEVVRFDAHLLVYGLGVQRIGEGSTLADIERLLDPCVRKRRSGGQARGEFGDGSVEGFVFNHAVHDAEFERARRVDDRGRVTHVGMLLRQAADGTISRMVVSGRVLYGERVRDALIRHLEKDLGPVALPQIPPEVAPFTVVEYFPDPDISGFHDPRHHAVSLAFVVPVSGDCQPTQEALDLAWYAPEQAVSESVRREMTGGHDRLIRLALAHVGQLP